MPRPPAAAAASAHRWRFFRAGGLDQVRLDTGADILRLPDLDQKLWVALSCPVRGLEFDERTLALLDSDRDGRVRAPEILAAVRWLGGVLRDPDVLVQGRDGVPLAAIDAAQPEGRRLLASARHVLASLGRRDDAEISVADATATARFFAQARLNGDGIVPPESVADAQAQRVARELLACFGGTPDRSGKPGFDRDRVNTFFAELRAYADWHGSARPGDPLVFPLGEATAAAWAALRAVRGKIDDWFGRCRLAAFDPRARELLQGDGGALAALAGRELSRTVAEARALPLAALAAEARLDLADGINPAWADAIAEFRGRVVAPLLGSGTTALTEAQWLDVQQRFSGYARWQAGKAGVQVESLGIDRAREILAGDAQPALLAAVDEDLAVAGEVDSITAVEKLARYCRDLHRLLRNFVSFAEFYGRLRAAVFQAGTLYLDGRSCELCTRVDDAGRHATMATLGRCYLAYCDLTRPGGERMTIAAAFTAGDSDYLMVGRNGLFYDRAGRDWDATITRIVEHVISIRQAFWAPYKKVLRWIEEQVAKRSAAADEAALGTLTGAADAGRPPGPKKFDASVVALFSVAIGAITGAFAAIVGAFAGMGPWLPVGVVGALLGISGPSMLIAYMKLRQRNLGPVLDANGWAVNGRVKINIPLGASLTQVAQLPPGSQRSLVDPYAPKPRLLPRLVLALLLLAGVWFALHRAGVAFHWDWYRTTWEGWFPPAPAEQPR